MCSQILRAGCGVAVVAAVLLAPAAVASPAGGLAPAVPTAVTDQFPLSTTPGRDGAGEGGLAGADADQAPVVVPLPPAVATGLMGLAGMALFRVGRRVYRRR
jgi:hypothetical protein